MKLIKSLVLSSLLLAVVFIVGCNETPTSSNELVGPNQQLSKTASSAVLHIFSYSENLQTVYIYGIKSDWTESGVKWSNQPSIYGTVEGSFVTDVDDDWLTADITGLVNKWLNGTYVNRGLLLSTSGTNLERFDSREGTNKPHLVITYSDGSVSVLDIADAFIDQSKPDINAGNNVFLYTGIIDGKQKKSLIKFDIGSTPPELGCETAYAKGPNATCFLDIPNKQGNNWGWTNEIASAFTGTQSWPIYAGAGQCDVSKGTQVGTLDVTYDGTTVTVFYNINSGFTLDETHLWIGSGMLPEKRGKYVSNPGGFNYNGQNSVSVDISAPFYIAAHSVVCGNY